MWSLESKQHSEQKSGFEKLMEWAWWTGGALKNSKVLSSHSSSFFGHIQEEEESSSVMNIWVKPPLILFKKALKICVIIKSTCWTQNCRAKEVPKVSRVLSKKIELDRWTSLETSYQCLIPVCLVLVCGICFHLDTLVLLRTGVKWKRFLILRESDSSQIFSLTS